MAGYINQNEYWNQNSEVPQQQGAYNFEIPPQQGFENELNFQSFDAGSADNSYAHQNIYGGNPYLNPSGSGFSGNMYTPSGAAAQDPYANDTGNFEDEPPLLEELGINPEFIIQKHLKTILDGAKQGAVYFSFGSNVQITRTANETLENIVKVLGQLPYKVLWKFDGPLPNKPDNVYVDKWFPQQDLLAHPNVKLFITQGGLQSTEEAIYRRVPLIVIPCFSDQMANAQRVVKREIGLSLDISSLDGDVFRRAIDEVISNRKYKDNILRLSEISGDQPWSPLEKSIWWIEYVLRHKGAYHLRSRAVDLPAYQYYLLDVVTFLLGCAVLIGLILYQITLRFYRLLVYLGLFARSRQREHID